ncbi:MAG: adenine deaminase [Desulfobacterales bacterium S5133MH4]|nr:MAG: adenine deaminase [Desulfobacterales bacterium S5133MH4]
MIYRLKKRIQAARGEIAPDLVLKGGSVVNVFSCEILDTDVAIYDGVIVGLGHYDGPEMIDVTGHYLCPGFIDGHFHVESSMLSPKELARAVIPMGTTAIVADPHEIANVMGENGIRYILDNSKALPVDIYIMLPSCVPATDLETSGARLTAEDILGLKDEPRVLGLAEMMNYPGVINGVEPVLKKIAAFNDCPKDGHAPLLSGKDLNAYIGAGIRSDHECTLLEEAREKLRLGMHIMIREGTQAKNLKTLLPIVSPATVRRCLLVTDDLHPHDLLEKGHMNHLLDMAIEQGLDPIFAIQMVTLNTAQYFGLKDLGAIAPGFQADIVILSSLRPVKVEMVFKRGKKVFGQGQLNYQFPQLIGTNSRSHMHIKPYGQDAFVIPQEGNHVRVIDLIRDQILTHSTTAVAPVMDGVVVSDYEQDLVKVAVVERHRASGNIGLGLVRGFGLKQGALASSVAHDSHNIVCVGCNDHDIHAAIKAVETMKGGLVATREAKVLAQLPLPIGGLMSERPLDEIARGWKEMRNAARNLGCKLDEPFMALSFLALPVIPELRVTDKGLVDVKLFEHVPLFMS